MSNIGSIIAATIQAMMADLLLRSVMKSSRFTGHTIAAMHLCHKHRYLVRQVNAHQILQRCRDLQQPAFK